jgi:hypothetical protein
MNGGREIEFNLTGRSVEVQSVARFDRIVLEVAMSWRCRCMAD